MDSSEDQPHHSRPPERTVQRQAKAAQTVLASGRQRSDSWQAGSRGLRVRSPAPAPPSQRQARVPASLVQARPFSPLLQLSVPACPFPAHRLSSHGLKVDSFVRFCFGKMCVAACVHTLNVRRQPRLFAHLLCSVLCRQGSADAFLPPAAKYVTGAASRSPPSSVMGTHVTPNPTP